jgi:hypothetical protein
MSELIFCVTEKDSISAEVTIDFNCGIPEGCYVAYFYDTQWSLDETSTTHDLICPGLRKFTAEEWAILEGTVLPPGDLNPDGSNLNRVDSIPLSNNKVIRLNWSQPAWWTTSTDDSLIGLLAIVNSSITHKIYKYNDTINKLTIKAWLVIKESAIYLPFNITKIGFAFRVGLCDGGIHYCVQPGAYYELSDNEFLGIPIIDPAIYSQIRTGTIYPEFNVKIKLFKLLNLNLGLGFGFSESSNCIPSISLSCSDKKKCPENTCECIHDDKICCIDSITGKVVEVIS